MHPIAGVQGMKALERLGRATLEAAADRYDIPRGREELIADFRILYDEYRPGEFFFVIESGRLEFRLPNPTGGDTAVIALGGGDVFNERTQPDGTAIRPVILEELSIYPLARQAAPTLFGAHRAAFEVEKRFLSGLKRRRLAANLIDMLWKGPTEKIAGWLAQAGSSPEGDGLTVGIDVVSEFTGESPIRARAVLAALAQRQAVRLSRHKIEIVSAETLGRLARRAAWTAAPAR